MKLTKYILAFGTGALLLGSCSDDFLDKKSLSSMTPDNLNAEMALTACYDGLQSKYIYNDNPWACGFFNMDCMTDNGGHFNWTGWMCGYDITNGTQTPSSWMISSFYQERYEVIKRCNLLISTCEDLNLALSDENRKIYTAEALVIRALMYLQLTMTYQDVPYITQPIADLSNISCPKTDRTTIIAAEMKNLKEAADVLPVSASDYGHVTKGAALSVLGRMALYNEKWDDAITAYRDVIGLGTYALYPDYNMLFTESAETSSEIIFSVRYEGPGSSEGSLFANHWGAPLESMNGSLDLANAFYKTDGKPYENTTSGLLTDGNFKTPDSTRYQNRDPRLKRTLFVSGMRWGTAADGASPFAAYKSKSTVFVYKYFDYNKNEDPQYGQNGQDCYVIRYPEILLSLAEALVTKDASYDYTEVCDLVNQVRNRVNMPTIAAAEELTQGGILPRESLLEVIKHERRVETAFEGLRLFDLYRWKELQKAEEVINKESELNQSYPEFFRYEHRNWLSPDEKNYVWPLPLNDIDTNSELKQHDLWK